MATLLGSLELMHFIELQGKAGRGCVRVIKHACRGLQKRSGAPANRLARASTEGGQRASRSRCLISGGYEHRFVITKLKPSLRHRPVADGSVGYSERRVLGIRGVTRNGRTWARSRQIIPAPRRSASTVTVRKSRPSQNHPVLAVPTPRLDARSRWSATAPMAVIQAGSKIPRNRPFV